MRRKGVCDHHLVLTPRALERRLKRHLLKEDHAFFVPCAPGFEDVLEAEVRALPGVEDVVLERGGAHVAGPLDVVYHANLHVATGQRVLLRVGTYLAQNFAMLYDHLRRVHWELYLGFAPGYRVRVTASQSRLNVAERIADVVDDAIRERVGDLGLAPVRDEDAPIAFHLRLYQDRCTVSVDTSGEHLHRRGVRTHVGDAPLRETLAAACLRAAEVGNARVVVDPFCGSGSLVVEAARMLAGMPAGSARTFAFEAMPWFQQSKWERWRDEAVASFVPGEVRIEASDLDERSLAALQRNLERLAVEVPVDVRRADALQRRYPDPSSEGRVLIVGNLPYGKRISSPGGAAALAQRFAATLEQRAAGAEVALVTRHPEAFEGPAFELLRRTDFRNGGLRVAFVHASVKPTNAGSAPPPG